MKLSKPPEKATPAFASLSLRDAGVGGESTGWSDDDFDECEEGDEECEESADAEDEEEDEADADDEEWEYCEEGDEECEAEADAEEEEDAAADEEEEVAAALAARKNGDIYAKLPRR